MARRNGETKDLTVQILTQIRDEMRGLRAAQGETNARLDQTNARLEVVETTLRDLAEQMLLLGRAVKVAIEHRKGVDKHLAEHERRIGRLEKRVG